MFRISDIRIGVKLAAVSGLGVLLVAGMLGTSLYSNAQIKAANGSATRCSGILVHDARSPRDGIHQDADRRCAIFVSP